MQSAPYRIDLEFKDAEGKPYKNTTTVKSKKDVAEEVPVYANKETIMGEVGHVDDAGFRQGKGHCGQLRAHVASSLMSPPT